MITYIKGIVDEVYINSIVVETKDGIGYFVNSDSYSVSETKSGDNVKLYTHQVIREDEHLLYGFKKRLTREIFEKLISVNGIGPKVALNILSYIPSENIAEAVISSNVAAFESVPGIGKKTAQRLVLELKEKFTGAEVSCGDMISADNIIEDAASALIGLGYQRNEALKTLSEVKSLGDTAEELVMLALKRLGR